jgi:hypothetical protein
MFPSFKRAFAPLALSALFLAFFATFFTPGASDALNWPKEYKQHAPDVTARLVSMGIQMGIVLADKYSSLSPWKDKSDEQDERADRVARTGHANFQTDHRLLADDNLTSSDVMGYAKSVRDGAIQTGDAAFVSSRDMGKGLHADRYEARIGAWMADMKGAIVKNKSAALDIIDAQRDINKMAQNVQGSTGYTRQIHAGTIIQLYAGSEMAKLQADIGRRLEVEALFMANEQNERTDRLEAFSAASSTWSRIDAGDGF